MPPGNATALPRSRRRSGAPADDSNPLLELATTAPPLRSGFVRRPGLAQLLTEARDAALALLIAPSGYGKSTLLAEWAACDGRPFVWVALGNVPPRTLSTASALRPRDGWDALAQLVRRTRRRHSSFVVVLDDAHLMAPSTLGQVLQAAISELPPGSAIAVASRSEPPLPIGKLRAHRQLTEIRTQQLAMAPAEAAALLRQAGLDPEFAGVRQLVVKTEGWPAALYLAALAAREDPEALAGFGGEHHLVSEYMRDEVLSALPSELVEFSIRTAVLDELCGPACDAVLERHGAAVVLERLARANPLLMPVDPAHHRYRWHALLHDTLRGELQRLEPELEPTLRLRASGWYAIRGDIDAAIGQGAAAGDAERTGRLLWQNILDYVTRGRNGLVRGWLGQFSSEQIADHVLLALSASLSALVGGDVAEARHWSLKAATALERDATASASSSVRQGLANALSLLDAISAHEGVVPVGDLPMRSDGSEPENSPWRSLCLLLAGADMHLRGDRAGAERALEESVRLNGNHAPSLASMCLSQRAMIAIERQDFDLAAELTDLAVAMAEEWDLADEPLSAIVFAAAAASRAHQGRIDEAKHDLRLGIDLLASLGDFVAWYEAEARILLAHASLWLADIVGARTLLAEASRFARRVPEAAVFSEWFESAWAYMDTLAETSLAGPSSLTIAELRILRFLPSHRSFREIAGQLGVSANTVKTQAHAVYRKLGAASRSEAISRAMEAGLLGQ
jgi:LuxR family transcriptional regulator, maltose regulon positive regulatory protein